MEVPLARRATSLAQIRLSIGNRSERYRICRVECRQCLNIPVDDYCEVVPGGRGEWCGEEDGGIMGTDFERMRGVRGSGVERSP